MEFLDFWIFVVVSLECVNVCKLSKGEGSGKYDCSMFSCAWKAPRVLTGFLASTAHSPQCSWLSYGRNGRRNRMNHVSCYAIWNYCVIVHVLIFSAYLYCRGNFTFS